MARVALDLLGGDGAPEAVADAVALLHAERPGIDLVLVGPSDLSGLFAERGIDPAGLRWLPAAGAVSMADAALPLVRADCGRPDAELTVTTAARAVRSGEADALVSVGHTGAAVAASVLTLGRIAGMSRPVLAVVLPALHHPVVLVDAGASLDATPSTLAQSALAGWAYARTLGLAEPVVGLLSIGHEPGKGDALRRSADPVLRERLASAGIAYAGNVEGHDVADGRRAQVVVTDGFTGNVLLKGIEGTVAWAAARMGAAYGDPGPARTLMHEVATGDFAGGMLLGVDGVAVVGHGAGTAEEIAACVRLAARAADEGIVRLTRTAFAGAVDAGA